MDIVSLDAGAPDFECLMVDHFWRARAAAEAQRKITRLRLEKLLST